MYFNKKINQEICLLEELCTYCFERKHFNDDLPYRNSIKYNDPIRNKSNYVDNIFYNFNNKRSIHYNINNINYSYNTKINHISHLLMEIYTIVINIMILIINIIIMLILIL